MCHVCGMYAYRLFLFLQLSPARLASDVMYCLADMHMVEQSKDVLDWAARALAKQLDKAGPRVSHRVCCFVIDDSW